MSGYIKIKWEYGEGNFIYDIINFVLYFINEYDNRLINFCNKLNY